MKLILPAAALLALAACTSRPENVYTVTADTTDPDGATYYLTYENGDSTVTDSAKVVGGKVTFTGNLDQTVTARLSSCDMNKYDYRRVMEFYLEPADITISITDPANMRESVTVSGSVTQAKADSLETELGVFENQISEVYNQYMDENRRLNDAGRAIADSLHTILTDMKVRFIRENPSSLLSLDIINMNQYMIDPETRLELYNSLSDDLKARDTALGKRIAAEITIMPGKPAPELKGIDVMTGKEVSLSDLKGKVVLLDFWATWCGPCRASLPHVEEVYNKYHDKGLEVFLLSCDRNINAWKKYIPENRLDKYYNVHEYGNLPVDEEGNFIADEVNGSQADKYAIVGIPAKFLIDRDGIIIGQFNIDEYLDEKLAEIFK